MFRYARDFYTENSKRRESNERDFGSGWRLDGYPHPWRVSYLQETREVYALHLDQLDSVRTGPLFLLGIVPGSPDDPEPREITVEHFWDDEDVVCPALERMLAGWEEASAQGSSLDWVRDRLTHD